jgi:pimeloyl-ACP methyl ester carboxylesterase
MSRAGNRSAAGYFENGLPYNRLGSGPRPLVIFQGLLFENKPQSPLTIQMYRFLGRAYTVYVVLRRPGLPPGYTLADMAGDYADMIRETFDGPVDIIGISTGGSIAQHFAADYPELVRRLVLHSSAYTLSEDARELQRAVGRQAEKRQWARAYELLFQAGAPRDGLAGLLIRPLLWLGARMMALNPPKDPNDLLVTIAAEDAFNFKERLQEIAAPTLVVAGKKDPFYTVPLFRETAARLPNALLLLFGDMGHPARGRRFEAHVLRYLTRPLHDPDDFEG